MKTTYAVSFRSSSTTFILVSMHVDYGHSSEERLPELGGISRWMAAWADRSTKWHHNLLTLGDFNIDRHKDDLWNTFISTGLIVPNELNQVQRSIFANPNNPMLDKFYDQIAWFQSDSGTHTPTMNYNTGGGFDFLPFVYTDKNFTKSSISYRISDHYPLWVKFKL